MDQVMGAYGYNIEHILMVDIIPDASVRKAMNEINAGFDLLLFFSCSYCNWTNFLIQTSNVGRMDFQYPDINYKLFHFLIRIKQILF